MVARSDFHCMNDTPSPVVATISTNVIDASMLISSLVVNGIFPIAN
jgi:hypothetical protein